MQKGPPTPKGFRDINPDLAKKRRKVISTIVDVLEEFGFEPIETPTIEFADTLKGKYGEEERLIYEFKDRGGRDLALRYDLTVPLARYVATYHPKLPFRRWQIGQVFRGENPQHGRWREFTQLDFDSVGSESLEEDALIIEVALKAARSLGLRDYQLKINSLETLKNIADVFNVPLENRSAIFREMDKVGKKDQKEIDRSIISQGNIPQSPYVSGATISGTISSTEEYKDPQTVNKLYESFRGYQPPPSLPKPTKEEFEKELKEALNRAVEISNKTSQPPKYKKLKDLLIQKGIDENEFGFDRRLVRGLDYYTGFLFELKPSKKIDDLTIGSGGRYDNLIGAFSKKPIPAVGFSFGLDRLIECLP